MWRALGQQVEVAGDRRETVGQRRADFGVDPQMPAVNRVDQALGLLREPGHAVEADDLERAVRLVQMGLAVLELRRVGGVGLILRQGVARAPERLLDLALDPGQRPDVEFDSAHAVLLAAACRWPLARPRGLTPP